MATIRPTGYLSHYGFSPEDTEKYLEHYGVKGMKWGKRLKTNIINKANAAADEYESKKRMSELYAEGAQKSSAVAEDAKKERDKARASAEKHREAALQGYRDAAKYSDTAVKFGRESAKAEAQARAKVNSTKYQEQTKKADAAHAKLVNSLSDAALRRVKQAQYADAAKKNKTGRRAATARKIIRVFGG